MTKLSDDIKITGLILKYLLDFMKTLRNGIPVV